MENKNPIQSAERIFLILEKVVELKSIGLIELSNQVGLHKSTVHRMLLSLIQLGYVEQQEANGKYSPSFKLVELAGKILDRTDEAAFIHPYLERLGHECNETVHLVKRSGNQVIYIDKVEPSIMSGNSIRMASHIGMVLPMYCSAVGKAILAHLSLEEVKAIFESSEVESKTPYTITSLAMLLEELKQVRELGYALDNEENELGVRCIAVAIKDARGGVSTAFSVSGPAIRMTDDKIHTLANIMLPMKNEISKSLGYTLAFK